MYIVNDRQSNCNGVRMAGSPGDLPVVSATTVTQDELALPMECSGGHEHSLALSQCKPECYCLDNHRQGKETLLCNPKRNMEKHQACGVLPPQFPTDTHSVHNDVQRTPADRMTPTTTRLCPTVTAFLPQPTGKSPVITDEESGGVSQRAVYSMAGASAKTKVISVADHPSQSASVEVGDLAEECNLDESDCDNESFISGSTQVGQKKTATKSSELTADQLLQAPNGTKRKPALENSLELGATATSIPFHEQRLKSPRHSPLDPQEPSTVPMPCNEGMVYNCAVTQKFKVQSTPTETVPTEAVSAGGMQVSATAETQTLPPPQSDCTEPKALLEYNSCPPRPCAVIDPLDSNSRELVEMVCSTVNSKWPILARYFCLSEEGIASIKEQDCEAEGRCWVLLLRLCSERITWGELHDMLLNKLHLNILACKMSQIFDLPPSDGHTVISCLNQAVIDIHNVMHKIVLLQLSQSISEQWKTLAKIIRFDQCTEVDNVHQILFNYKDADECCCEMLLQWITWRQAQVESASLEAVPVTFGELFSLAEAAVSGTAVEKVILAAKDVL